MEAEWRGALGGAFVKQFERWTSAEQLDVVLTAGQGFCDRFTSDGSPAIVCGEGSLVRGLFRLLSALREKATVTAIEWDKYETVLALSVGS